MCAHKRILAAHQIQVAQPQQAVVLALLDKRQTLHAHRAALPFAASGTAAQREDFAAFQKDHANWLDDFALFARVAELRDEVAFAPATRMATWRVVPPSGARACRSSGWLSTAISSTWMPAPAGYPSSGDYLEGGGERAAEQLLAQGVPFSAMPMKPTDTSPNCLTK